MSKSAITVILKAAGAALLVYLVLQMGIGLLAVKGTLPEGKLLAAQGAAMALSLLPAGWYAAGKAGLGARPGALLTAVCLCAVLALLGLLIFDGPAWGTDTAVLLGSALAGSVLAGVLGGCRRKRKKRPALRR